VENPEAATGIAGIDQLFETVGSHARDALIAQIHRNERGLPENPTIGMVEGHGWRRPGCIPSKQASLSEGSSVRGTTKPAKAAAWCRSIRRFAV
jgi:hypothetical protein